MGLSGDVLASQIYAKRSHTDTQFRLGFSGGLSGLHVISERLSVEGRIHYMQKGFRHDLPISIDYQTPENLTLIHRFDYLTLPITANLAFGKKNQYFGSLGAFAAYLLNAKISTRKDLSADLPGFDINLEDVIQPYHAGVVIGGGYKFPLSTTADLQLALKYYFSMINASDGMYLNWENFKQQALTFGVTAYFHRQRTK